MKHLLSLDSLMQIIRHNKVSIRSYIKDGILPEPIIDGESLFFDKNELEEKLNKSLDEPFLLIEEASSLTGLSKSHITIMCGKDSFPHFSYDLLEVKLKILYNLILNGILVFLRNKYF